MDLRASLAIALVAAGCGAAAPTAGTGAPLRAGATPRGAATGLRTARALSSGLLSYAVAYRGADVVAVELATSFELVAGGDRVELGSSDYDVVDLAVDPVGARAWVASLDGTVRAVDLERGEVVTRWHLGAPATAVAVSDDGNLVATGDGTGVVCLRRAADGALLHCAAIHEGAVSGLDFSGDRLASSAWSGDVIVWQVPSMRVDAKRTRRGSANAVAFSPDGARLAVGWSLAPPERSPAVVDRETRRGFGAPDPFATVEILDATGSVTVAATGHAAAVTSVAWTPDGARVLSGSWDRTVRMWDPAGGEPIARLGGFAYLIADLAVSPDARHVAVAAWGATLDARATTLVDLLYP